MSVTVLAFAVGFSAGIVTNQWLDQDADITQLAVVKELPSPTGWFGDTKPAVAHKLAAEWSVSAALQAPPRAATVRRPSVEEGDSLTSGAETIQQARIAKASVQDRGWSNQQVTVARGDTLMDILIRTGVDRGEAHAAVTSLRTVYDPRRLRAGQDLMITAGLADTGSRPLFGLRFDVNFDHAVQVVRRGDGRYDATEIERPQRRELVRRAGDIDASLYLSAERAAVPHDTIIQLIKLFSWDVDFQRDVRAGDQFEALFEEVSLEDGSSGRRGGDLLFADLTVGGEHMTAYRYEHEDGRVAYFDRTGRSLRKFLMRTPIDGARLSSSFGMRRHPILGYNRMHKGMDFAAPTGTPIYAAGDGKVESAARNGGYGNYVKIRHTGEYSTAYAHLSRFGPGIRAGKRVRQGEVIGYVGTTGRSTGAHLHYEVIRNGEQINPLNLKQPPTMQLANADLRRFRQEIARIDGLRARLRPGTQLASTTTTD